jgi:hypothetical protein
VVEQLLLVLGGLDVEAVVPGLEVAQRHVGELAPLFALLGLLHAQHLALGRARAVPEEGDAVGLELLGRVVLLDGLANLASL